jgi:hypothetical protein
MTRTLLTSSVAGAAAPGVRVIRVGALLQIGAPRPAGAPIWLR